MSSVATQYPVLTEGMAALSRLYAAFKAGTAGSDLSRTAKDAWLFVGMGQRVTLGDPDADTPFLVAFTDDGKQLLTEMQVALDTQPEAFSLSPVMRTLLRELIADMLKKLLGG